MNKCNKHEEIIIATPPESKHSAFIKCSLCNKWIKWTSIRNYHRQEENNRRKILNLNNLKFNGDVYEDLKELFT